METKQVSAVSSWYSVSGAYISKPSKRGNCQAKTKID